MSHPEYQPPQPPQKPPSWWDKLTGGQAAVLGVSIYVLAPIVGTVLIAVLCCGCFFWSSIVSSIQMSQV
jgi:hypothetical protein